MGSDERKQAAVGVGLIGLGTIGTGVAKVLRENQAVIEQRLGFPLELRRIADLDTETDRGIDLSDIHFDADAEGLIADPSVQIVIELIGGYDVAKRMTLASIAAGKHVVTANKALLALHGAEIFEAAQTNDVDVAFEASVGGGIPILRSLREGLAANEIESVLGILNGTTNYVLTQMESTGEAFEPVLARAQELGYAEADPTFDVEGVDAAHKLTLLAAMAFGARMTFEDIPTEGIRGLLPIDFEMAEHLGYRVKLLGIAKTVMNGEGAERIDVRVHPTMVPIDSLLASVDGAMNAIAVTGNAVGPTLFYGAGAGEMPTASAVVADLREIARNIRGASAGRVAPLSYALDALTAKPLAASGDRVARCYLRFTALDEPGVLAHITGALGQAGVGIESVFQEGQGEDGEAVPVVMLTHPAREADICSAIETIDARSDVTAPTKLIRIEEEL